MPFPYTQAVLSYTVQATNVTPAQMKVAMEQVVLDTTDFPAVNLTSDTTVETATGAERTLIFALQPAFNTSLAPPASVQVTCPCPPQPPPTALPVTADPAAFFQNFYTLTLSKALVAPVVQLPPIVT